MERKKRGEKCVKEVSQQSKQHCSILKTQELQKKQHCNAMKIARHCGALGHIWANVGMLLQLPIYIISCRLGFWYRVLRVLRLREKGQSILRRALESKTIKEHWKINSISEMELDHWIILSIPSLSLILLCSLYYKYSSVYQSHV